MARRFTALLHLGPSTIPVSAAVSGFTPLVIPQVVIVPVANVFRVIIRVKIIKSFHFNFTHQ
jgi:hypothetical protein